MALPLPEYDDLDATALAELVRQGAVSPGELVEAAVARVEARNPALNAVIDRQFAQARAATPSDGPFRAVPFLLKDLKGEQAGERCTDGSRLLAEYRPTEDSELVRRFRAAGLVVCGRTNTPELGIYPVTEPELFGPARNPWNLDHSPGGSSGGAASAVAARLVPVAHASDGGGSIRIPAAHCGLVGLKPTRARTPFAPHVAEGWGGYAIAHVVSRSVRDTAALLDCVQGPVAGAPYQVLPPERPFAEEVAREPGRLRIALVRQALFTDENHPDCLAAVDDAATLARSLGHEVEEASLPIDRDALVRAYFTTVAAGVAVSVDGMGRKVGRRPRRGDVETATWFLRLIGRTLTAADYVAARDAVHQAGLAMARFHQRYDVLLTPTTARPAPKVGELQPRPAEAWALALLDAVPVRAGVLKALEALSRNALRATGNTMLFNQTGQPAISLPLHWGPSGLPIGTQWVAAFGGEATLLRLAGQLERARPWAHRKPAPVA